MNSNPTDEKSAKKLTIQEIRKLQKSMITQLKQFKVRKVIYWDYNPNAPLETNHIPQPLMLSLQSFKQRFKSYTSGANGSYAISEDGELFEWGESYQQQVNQSVVRVNFNSAWLTQQPQMVNFQTKISKVSLTYSSALALDCQGNLRSWGSDPQRYGVLGLGEYVLNVEEPKLILEGVNNINSSLYHCIAQTIDKQTYGWGSNLYNQLSQEKVSSLMAPSKLQLAEELKDVSLAPNLTGYITASGQVLLQGTYENAVKQKSLDFRLTASSLVFSQHKSQALNKDQQQSIKMRVPVPIRAQKIICGSSMTCIFDENGNFFIFTKFQNLYELQLDHYKLLDVQNCCLSSWLLVQSVVEDQKYLIELKVLLDHELELNCIMISKQFNKGIAGFTCPTNFNGQVSLMFDETIDIEKINQEYEQLKRQMIQRKMVYKESEDNNGTPRFCQKEEQPVGQMDTQKFIRQKSTRDQKEELNFSYQVKRLGVSVELAIICLKLQTVTLEERSVKKELLNWTSGNVCTTQENLRYQLQQINQSQSSQTQKVSVDQILQADVGDGNNNTQCLEDKENRQSKFNQLCIIDPSGKIIDKASFKVSQALSKETVLQDITQVTNNCSLMLTERDKHLQISQCSYVNFMTSDKSNTPWSSTPDIVGTTTEVEEVTVQDFQLQSNKYEAIERILEKKAFQNKLGAFQKYLAVVQDEKRSINLQKIIQQLRARSAFSKLVTNTESHKFWSLITYQVKQKRALRLLKERSDFLEHVSNLTNRLQRIVNQTNKRVFQSLNTSSSKKMGKRKPLHSFKETLNFPCVRAQSNNSTKVSVSLNASSIINTTSQDPYSFLNETNQSTFIKGQSIPKLNLLKLKNQSHHQNLKEQASCLNSEFERSLHEDLVFLDQKLGQNNAKVKNYMSAKYSSQGQFQCNQSTADRFPHKYQRVLYNMTSKHFEDVKGPRNYIKENIKNSSSQKQQPRRRSTSKNQSRIDNDINFYSKHQERFYLGKIVSSPQKKQRHYSQKRLQRSSQLGHVLTKLAFKRKLAIFEQLKEAKGSISINQNKGLALLQKVLKRRKRLYYVLLMQKVKRMKQK